MENIHFIFIELCTKEDIFPYLEGNNSYENKIEKAYNFRIKSEIRKWNMRLAWKKNILTIVVVVNKNNVHVTPAK